MKTYVGGFERAESLEVALRAGELVDITLQGRNAVSSFGQGRDATFPLVEPLRQTLQPYIQRYTALHYSCDTLLCKL